MRKIGRRIAAWIAAMAILFAFEAHSPVYAEENGMVRLSQRNRFFRGETVSVLEPGEVPYDLTLSEIYNEDMEPIESAPHATMTVYLKTDRKIKEGAFLRVKRS